MPISSAKTHSAILQPLTMQIMVQVLYCARVMQGYIDRPNALLISNLWHYPST